MAVLVLAAAICLRTLVCLLSCQPSVLLATASFDYTDALSKSLLFFESQRSGRLPSDQRVSWRGDSALLDGRDSNINLVGGYYDAGDNVKFGFPMAFTITMLSWGATEYAAYFSSAGELEHIQKAIRWGTDYLVKTNTGPAQLWVQVGDANADHNCWERPEDMDTPRTVYQINASNPGTEVAAETAAALASASIVFKNIDSNYSYHLLQRAATLFDFADRYRASYTGECPFYCSYSGYNDELLWAATWLFKATHNSAYLRYIQNSAQNSVEATEFTWDNKFAGVQVLLSQVYFKGETSLQPFKSQAEFFLCSNLPGNPITQISTTPGGLLYVRQGSNTQYAGGVSFLAAMYADYLIGNHQSAIMCGNRVYHPEDMLEFAQRQVDYVLGKNPLNMSYMVGFGRDYPKQAHHRGASIVSIHKDATMVGCQEGFSRWFNSDTPNPNVLVGAIVGGPDQQDHFTDQRSNFQELEPTTCTNAVFVGVLARLSSMKE